MNPMTEKKLEKLLRQAPSGGDLDRAVQGVIARAERDGLIDVAYATVDSPFGSCWSHEPSAASSGWRCPSIAATSAPRTRCSRTWRGSSRRGCSSRRSGSTRSAASSTTTSRASVDHFDVPVDWKLTPPGFRNRALHAVARIPYGETRTYGEIAQQAGNPRAFRAAGTACGRNPIPLIVPCHRVVQRAAGSATTAAARR